MNYFMTCPVIFFQFSSSLDHVFCFTSDKIFSFDFWILSSSTHWTKLRNLLSAVRSKQQIQKKQLSAIASWNSKEKVRAIASWH